MPTLAQLALMQRVNLSAHGVNVTITLPDDTIVVTTGIWHRPLENIFGSELRRREPKRVIEIPLDDTLAGVPRGSTLVAKEREDTAATTWVADGTEQSDDPLRTYVVVVPSA